MNQLRIIAIALTVLATGSGSASAGDVQAGEKLAQQLCASCHGPTGKAENPLYPVLAGQYADYLLHALKSYKSGDRGNAVMAGIASGLSEEDMKNLSAYYAAQEGLQSLDID